MDRHEIRSESAPRRAKAYVPHIPSQITLVRSNRTGLRSEVFTSRGYSRSTVESSSVYMSYAFMPKARIACRVFYKCLRLTIGAASLVASSRRHCMAILLIWSVLLGAVLGRFFKVLVLVPACAFLLVAVLVRSADGEHGLLRPLLEFAVLITSLQIGYVSGLLSFLIHACRNAK